jgi:hypothetical protein
MGSLASPLSRQIVVDGEGRVCRPSRAEICADGTIAHGAERPSVRLEIVRRYPGCTFESSADLARHIAYTAILDLLVASYAKEAAEARDVAEGFIREMAARVAADPHLDLEGMKQAVRTAIDIYEQEIAGGRT